MPGRDSGNPDADPVLYRYDTNILIKIIIILIKSGESGMSFTLIRGHFMPLAGIPDGDSVRFLADNNDLWKKLEGKPVRLGTGEKTKGTVQLRFEGIDAIEKKATNDLAKASRDSMFALIGFDEENDPEPAGYILSRMTDDKSGRPICFVFTGTTRKKDGSTVYLERPVLRESVNYRQAEAGYAYPLYYNTLFTELRETIDEAIIGAKRNGYGYWPDDRTLDGVTVECRDDLFTIAPVWPKLWRRLDEYLRKNASLDGFAAFLEERNERIDILSTMEEQGLQDVVEVDGDTVRLKQPPENLRVRAKAGRRNR
jgi:endonuclease YncB( thermonuclease family)